jgi:hypothetical protein
MSKHRFSFAEGGFSTSREGRYPSRNNNLAQIDLAYDTGLGRVTVSLDRMYSRCYTAYACQAYRKNTAIKKLHE